MENKHPKGFAFIYSLPRCGSGLVVHILGIFVLYMIDPTETGGLAIDDKNADDIFWNNCPLSYPFPWRFLADKILGYVKVSSISRRCLMGWLYWIRFIQEMPMFYTSLGLIIIGNGFFKPGISTLLGNLYSDEQYKDNKDAGYNIFYIGDQYRSICMQYYRRFYA